MPNFCMNHCFKLCCHKHARCSLRLSEWHHPPKSSVDALYPNVLICGDRPLVVWRLDEIMRVESAWCDWCSYKKRRQRGSSSSILLEGRKRAFTRARPCWQPDRKLQASTSMRNFLLLKTKNEKSFQLFTLP